MFAAVTVLAGIRPEQAAAGAPVPGVTLTVARTVKLGGDRPRDLALSADGASLFVASGTDAGGGGKLRILSAATGKPLCRDLAVGGNPTAVALSSGGKYAYVSGTGSDGKSATRINLARCETAGEVGVAPAAGALAFGGDGKYAYLAGESEPRLDVVDAQWNQVDSTVKGLPKGIRRALVTASGRFLFLAATGGRLVKFDLVANAIAKTLPVDGTDLAASADGSRLFVGGGDADAEIKIVTTAADTIEKSVDTGMVPGALATGPDDHTLWVALPHNGKVALVDLESGTVLATVRTGRSPIRVVAAPDGKSAWVANAGDATLTQVDLIISAAVAEAPIPAPAVPVASPPSGTRYAMAVSEMEAQGIAASAAAIVTDWMRDELVKAAAYKVLERRAMDAIMSEQAIQQTGCTDQDCAVKLGKMLNVQRMLLGTLGKFEDSYVLNVRVVNVESAELVWTGGARGKTIDDVEAGVRRVARDLSRQAP